MRDDNEKFSTVANGGARKLRHHAGVLRMRTQDMPDRHLRASCLRLGTVAESAVRNDPTCAGSILARKPVGKMRASNCSVLNTNLCK